MSSTTKHSWFEAVFDRRLKPRGAFADELRAAGYDPLRAQPEYPTTVWLDCLEIARRHVWPNLERDAAYHNLGTEFALGFLETILGRVVGAAISFMTPASFMRRMANYMHMGRSDDAGQSVELVKVEPRRVEMELVNPSGVPATYVAGIIDVACRHMRVTHTVTVKQHDTLRSTITLEWT